MNQRTGVRWNATKAFLRPVEQRDNLQVWTGAHIRRLLLARAMVPLPGNAPLVAALQQHGQAVFGEPIPAVGTPLYTDVRLYGEHGIPGVIYGAGPRTVLEFRVEKGRLIVEKADISSRIASVRRCLKLDRPAEEILAEMRDGK